jgi:uncharacterized glyoxalase superfamily protein PhnB/uncharacterized protein YndB with AHSA1/START domain
MSNQKTQYVKDLANRKITATRSFNAPLYMVWKAWTDKDILDQWWAPWPWQAKTKSMNFTTGGQWLYAMVGSKADYVSVTPMTGFHGKDVFCDEHGNNTPGMPETEWLVSFTPAGESTLARVEMTCGTNEQLKQLIDMGFEQGFAMAHENLDQYLEAQFRLREQMKPGRARVASYLNFPCNTEEAMNFYRSVFGTEFSGGGIYRFGDIPQEAGHPPVAENVRKMILHVELPITAGHVLQATDAPKKMGMTITQGNNMHICIEPETRTETKRLFNALSEGGKVSMQLADMFWGAYFGSFTDKYGINWMLNCAAKE